MISAGDFEVAKVGAPSESSSSANPVGTNGGLYMLGRSAKSLVQAVQTFRKLGVEILGLPLPEIVVIGDQSIGKSFFIEGISEIKVPRHVGTYTRYPLEINLVESSGINSQWIYKITLVTRYHHDSELLKRATKSFRRN